MPTCSAGYTAASLELLSDATGFEGQLMGALGMSAAEELDAAFISGSGVGQPLGYLRAANLLVLAKEVGQAAGSLVYENVMKMLSHSTAPRRVCLWAIPAFCPRSARW